MPQWREKTRKNKVRSDAKWANISAIPVIRTLVALGCTESDIGIILDVEGTTINSWKQRYPDIFAASEEGKKILKGKVFAEMIRAATGYDYLEKDIKYAVLVGSDGVETIDHSHKTITEHQKYQPGSPALLQFIATNLMPETFPRNPVAIEQNIVALIGDVEAKRIQDFAGRLLELTTKQVDNRILNESVESGIS